MTSRNEQRYCFYLEMAKLVAAGFGIREAAAVLKETRLPIYQLELLNGLEKGLAQGMSIATAYSQEGLGVSEIEKNILDAGEKSGRLASAFQHLAEYFGLVANARRHLLKSILYPALVLHLGIFISVVPDAILNDTGGIWSQLLVTLLCVYAVGFASFLAVRTVGEMAVKKEGVDTFINRIPLIGPVRKNLAMARFTKVYHACLLAGLTISEATMMAASAAHSGSIFAAGKKLSLRAFNGDLLGPAFVSEDAFPKAFARSYATAELSGSLDKDMERWSLIYQQQSEASIRTMSIMLPKIVGGLVMLFVAWKILGFWSDYYGKLESITE